MKKIKNKKKNKNLLKKCQDLNNKDWVYNENFLFIL